MLYASSDPLEHATSITVDANSYPPFKLLDTSLVHAIAAELDLLDASHDERRDAPSALVGALTKALCRPFAVFGPFSPSLIMARCQSHFLLAGRGAASPRWPAAVSNRHRPPHSNPLTVA